MTRKTLLICGTVLIGAFILALAARYAIRKSFNDLLIPQTVTDVSEYPSLLSKWSQSGLTAHFPSSLPSTATDVRLSSFPGFLQGGPHLQLYVRLPLQEAAAIGERYVHLATHTFQGGDTNDHANESNGVPTTFFYTSGTKDTKFDSSFTIYVLSSKPAKLAVEGGLWNHGESCGLAVNRKNGVVVYWAESW
jgi:hypothetical protein